jgi:hypothetical protein
MFERSLGFSSKTFAGAVSGSRRPSSEEPKTPLVSGFSGSDRRVRVVSPRAPRGVEPIPNFGFRVSGDDAQECASSRRERRIPVVALAFDADGSRVAGYRDAGPRSRVRVWHFVSKTWRSSHFGISGLTSLGARVAGAVAGTGAPAATSATLGCVDSFLCGETGRLDDPGGGQADAGEPPVALLWRGNTVTLRRGGVEAAFGVKE